MNLIFFQNIISPHQMPYIQHLPKMEGVEQVVVIVPEVNLEERDSLGWNTDKWLQTEGVQFLVAPTEEEVERVLNVNETLRYETLRYENENQNEKVTWCLFSGINAFPEVAKWFRMSLKYNVRRGVITEPPYVYDHPLWQHAIRFAVKDWRYVKYIDKIFVMGEDYLSYYRFWSKRWDVIPFMYCTEGRDGNVNVNDNDNVDENENENQNENENRQPSAISHQPSPISHQTSDFSHHLKILYVGSLSRRKNVQCLLKACMLLSQEEQERLEIGIVGDGEQRTELERMSRNAIANIHFEGSIPMEKVPAVMEQYDILVLPSLHDGWGAVVNEALTLGLYVICSDHCGAKMLLKHADNGRVFKNNSPSDLSIQLKNCLKKKEWIRSKAIDRFNWSMRHISGIAVANHFLSCLKHFKNE